jgi:hypothetical protein
MLLWIIGGLVMGRFAEAVLSFLPEGSAMPYWINAKIKEGAFSVVVETAKDALAKLAELSEAGHSDVTAKDMAGTLIGLSTLQSDAEAS